MGAWKPTELTREFTYVCESRVSSS